MRKHAASISYDEVLLLGKPALFTQWRVGRSTVPPRLHLYELRHEDKDWSRPCQVAQGVLVNFYGTVLTAEPLELGEDGRRDMEPADLVFQPQNNPSIEYFLTRYGNG